MAPDKAVCRRFTGYRRSQFHSVLYRPGRGHRVPEIHALKVQDHIGSQSLGSQTLPAHRCTQVNILLAESCPIAAVALTQTHTGAHT